MTRRHVLAIDQGTTGTTVLVVDHDGQIVGRGYSEFPQRFPNIGWVEHDPEEIWGTVEGTVPAALADAGIAGADIAAIGITNQRETTVLWRREDGRPVHNAIVWQCRRTTDLCTSLKKDGHEALFRERTGLVLDPYFSGTKIRWLLDNVTGAREAAEAGELAFGTVDTFLLSRLTGGAVHGTDPSNASRTLLFNLHTLSWDEELAGILGVPMAVLPKIVDNSGICGETRGLGFLPDGIPVAGMAGDQQAALFGQACFEAGEAKCTYGTGAFLLVNTGEQPIVSSHGLLTTVGWRLDGRTTYALEGSAFIAGAAVQWLRDGLGLISKASEIEALAASVPDSGGVVFVPALTGLGAPHWRPEARGSILGISRGTTAGHFARATLEGIALQNVDILKAMEQDLGAALKNLKVDGGACANDLLMQIQADLLGRTVIRPRQIETTGMGSAYLAGLGVGLWSSPDEIRARWMEDCTFSPNPRRAPGDALIARWNEAISKA
ncbi:MAG: glycerol kinase GlpK [Pseudomonadota bacterium]